MEKFYITSKEALTQKFDGMIITGAPVEKLPFENIDYWEDLCAIMDYAKKNVFCTLYICWGAQAGLYHHYDIPKYILEKKQFGIFKHQNLFPHEPLLRGFDDIFPSPVSRHTEIRSSDIQKNPHLTILAESEEAGVLLVKSNDNRNIFITGHLEYDRDTLNQEYKRDIAKGDAIEIPKNYFPEDNPNNEPLSSWRSHAHLFFSNWLNYYVYQETPFEFV